MTANTKLGESADKKGTRIQMGPRSGRHDERASTPYMDRLEEIWRGFRDDEIESPPSEPTGEKS